MGYISELKSKTKGTRYKAVINIRRKSDGIEYFDTETFSSKASAKAWLKREEERLENNPHLLSTSKGASMGISSWITHSTESSLRRVNCLNTSIKSLCVA